MNETANKFLLIGDNFMLEMHFKQSRFIKSTCGSFTKTKKKIKEVEDLRQIYRKEVKPVFDTIAQYGWEKNQKKTL